MSARFLDPQACRDACERAAAGLNATADKYEADGDAQEAARLREGAARHLAWRDVFADRLPSPEAQEEAA
jgi:hypothetical protein